MPTDQNERNPMEQTIQDAQSLGTLQQDIGAVRARRYGVAA